MNEDVSDDPWRKPDPGSSPPAAPEPASSPGYGAVPGYGPPPGYASPPPGYPGFNPYAAPPPQRGGIARLVWILSILGVLLLGGCGVAVFFFVQSVSKNADTVNNFLQDVRNQQFSRAYSRLCPDVRAGEPAAAFVQSLQSARDRGHGVSSYDITSARTSSVNGFTTRTAGGSVKFADDTSQIITFGLEKSGSGLCVASGYRFLS